MLKSFTNASITDKYFMRNVRNDLQIANFRQIIHYFIIVSTEYSDGFIDYKLEMYYQRIDQIIDHKLCDESTINGTLNYDQTFLTKIDECEQITDYKV